MITAKMIRSTLQVKSQLQAIPGPKLRNPLEFSQQMTRDPISYMKRMMDQYGDIVSLPAPLMPIVQVTEADLIGKILVGTEKNNTKSLGYRRLQALLGEGLLTSSGHQWRIQRKLTSPSFHPKKIEDFFQVITNEVDALADAWEAEIASNSVVDLSRAMSKLTFTIIVKVLFSMDLSKKADTVREALGVLQEYANHLFYSLAPLPMWMPLPMQIKARKSLRELDDIVYQLIEEHKKAPDRYQDLLSDYLQAKDEESGAKMSDQLVRDEVITLMLAGHDTTASSISLCLELLAKHPNIQDKLYQENNKAFAGSTLPIQKLSELHYNEMVFSESMRLYPAAWAVGRESSTEIQHREFKFPAKTTFLLVQYLTHRNPRYWPEPDSFQPERFAAENVKQQKRFAYFPFGGGPRSCIGASLARLESQIIIPRLLKRFRFEPLAGHQPLIHPKISLVLEPGVKLHVFRR